MSATTKRVQAGLKKRYAREKRFRFYGLISIIISFIFLLVLLFTIFSKGLPAFQQTYIKLDVVLDEDLLGVNKDSTPDELFRVNYGKVIDGSLKTKFPDVSGRKNIRALKNLVSKRADYILRDKVIANPDLLGTSQSYWFLAKDDVDVFMKGDIDRNLPESDRRIKDYQLAWIDQLIEEGRLERRFNTVLFTAGDSGEPEQAGMKGVAADSAF